MSNQNLIRETSIMASFSVLPDPRKSRNQKYPMFDIIAIAILGILCGADDWVDIALWGESNIDWLKQFGIGNGGISSHDTFSRFFRYVNPVAFEKCFLSWTQKISKIIGGVIALDGKTICNSKNSDKQAIHLISAFSVENNLILGQLATKAKSNEITSFPLLIEMLDCKEAIITIDAAGCQKSIASLIYKKGGDYVLGLKKNHKNLYDEVDNFFDQALVVKPEEADCDYYMTEEKSRSRFEKREVRTTSNLDWLPQLQAWEGLSSIACVKSTRIVKDKKSIERRYYISSLKSDAEKIGKSIRSHWSIENKLHWQLDISYGEDNSKIRKDNGAENFSILRRATLNLLKADTKTKAGIKNKRSKAGWNKQYMADILAGNVK
jgi:predicted transposase YbfD/YdcC